MDTNWTQNIITSIMTAHLLEEFYFCAESGTRTRTPFAGHRILSPVRLPIPPSRQRYSKNIHVFAHKITCSVCAVSSTIKTKSFLTSVSHSGILQKIKGNSAPNLFSGMMNNFICASKIQNNGREGKKISFLI